MRVWVDVYGSDLVKPMSRVSFNQSLCRMIEQERGAYSGPEMSALDIAVTLGQGQRVYGGRFKSYKLGS